jgi:hypothetical protein
MPALKDVVQLATLFFNGKENNIMNISDAIVR